MPDVELIQLILLMMSTWLLETCNQNTCIPDGHLHRVTYAKCRIDTIDSPDDEHLVARNM